MTEVLASAGCLCPRQAWSDCPDPMTVGSLFSLPGSNPAVATLPLGRGSCGCHRHLRPVPGLDRGRLPLRLHQARSPRLHAGVDGPPSDFIVYGRSLVSSTLRSAHDRFRRRVSRAARAGIRRRGTPRLSPVRAALLRIRPRRVHGLRPGPRRRVLLQGTGGCPSCNGRHMARDRSPSRQSRHPAGARAAVGDLRAEAIARHARRSARGRRGPHEDLSC